MVSSILICATVYVMPALAAPEEPGLKFEKSRIGAVIYEAASACDVDNNGVVDIISGEYWFSGPDFQTAHKICDIMRVDDYYDDFSNYPMDVNGDGFMDIVTGGWWGKSVRWRENPKVSGVEWKTHDVAETGNVERASFWDVDGDGKVEVVPNCPGNPFVVFKLVCDANGKGTGKFEKTVISNLPQGHGMGCGDIAGNKRADIISAGGWLEAPAEPLKGEWIWHAEFDLKSASVPILVFDVNADGANDLIVGQGHDYGLAWYEQGRDDKGARTWTKHDIDTKRSQYHDLQLHDIDNDGQVELITGKRYRAHQEHDPGSLDPLGIYYFKIKNGTFERHTIDYGPADKTSGAGIYFWVQDIDGNGWKDIVAPGKEGLYLFKNMGPQK